MIYTCYDMIRDCRADRAEGWSYFISSYVPVIHKLLAHYGDTARLDRVLLALRQPESSLFDSQEPAPERCFVAGLRQKVLAELETSPAENALDLETVAAALEPLTVTEKQAAWTETMRYTPAETAAMLRMAPETVEKIRSRAGELLRARVDTWNRTLLASSGAALGREAVAAAGNDCLAARAFLDILDGRSTWRERADLERHVTKCWHCIDHFCRMAEIVYVLRGLQPLAEAEAAQFRQLLGIQLLKRQPLKRWFS